MHTFTDDETARCGTPPSELCAASDLDVEFEAHWDDVRLVDRAEFIKDYKRMIEQEDSLEDNWCRELAECEELCHEMKSRRRKTLATLEEYVKCMGTTVEEEHARIAQLKENRRHRNDHRNRNPPKCILTTYDHPMPSEHEIGDGRRQLRALGFDFDIFLNRGRRWGDDPGAMRLANNIPTMQPGDQVLCQVVGCCKPAGKKEAHLDVVFEGFGEDPVRIPRSSSVKNMLKSRKVKWPSYTSFEQCLYYSLFIYILKSYRFL
ncbi:hypothetical protein FISHEDRAFT_62907 [Fistulina hepatica ATCC 64428]|uniref:Uncharacterized protein n=1 Tax=Fistulina hepatica ATCC 64428 TaxID=1128425 RepID=A0A0D7A2H1_9AGAR|nr:hypothetical protein FISHEDRAFT_62907 [Fistulina hepatica ATCC 64428]